MLRDMECNPLILGPLHIRCDPTKNGDIPPIPTDRMRTRSLKTLLLSLLTHLIYRQLRDLLATGR